MQAVRLGEQVLLSNADQTSQAHFNSVSERKKHSHFVSNSAVKIYNAFPVHLVDDTDKTDPEESTDVTIHAEPEIDPCTLNGTCPEVIKVYIFNADPSKDDQGKEENFVLSIYLSIIYNILLYYI